MEDPVREISEVIQSLTQSTPSMQRGTIEKYFTPNASFTHPFCRTGSFSPSEHVNSRNLILAIYRWYKIMSPRIDLQINSIAYDPASLLLYVNMSQKFRIWIVPFYLAPVNLVTVLQLERDKKMQKYLIRSQNDLYQVDEFVRFFWFGGYIFVCAWQVCASSFCLIGALLLWPQTWVEENWLRKGWTGLAR